MPNSVDESIRSILAPITTSIRDAAGDDLEAVVLYGSAARGEHLPGASDLNLMIVSKALPLERLVALAPSLTRHWRSHRVRPYLVTGAELRRLSDVFPVKILEVRAAHVILHGKDPLDSVSLDAEHLRIHVEQELRNHLIRLRWRLVQTEGEAPAIARALSQSARGLRAELFGLCHVLRMPPVSPAQRDVFDRARECTDLDRSTLDLLQSLALRQTVTEPMGDVAGQTLRLLEHAVQIADRASVEGSI